jgi:TonB family protein
LLDALVIDYTHMEFAREALRAAKLWTYRPAIVGGEPVGVRQELVVDFEPDRMTRRLTPVNTMDRRFEQVVPKKVIEVYARERDLDSPLALIASPPPPSVNIPEDRRVTVDFYVDQEGKPRLPVIISTDDPLLSDLALQTIKEWRFAPPTRNGKPAITRARQEFVFHGADEEKADAAT